MTRQERIAKFNLKVAENIGQMLAHGMRRPRYFIRMANSDKELGYYGAVRRLLAKPGLQSTFIAMHEAGLLHLTTESLVVSAEHRDLFSALEIAEAERRLAAVQRPRDPKAA